MTMEDDDDKAFSEAFSNCLTAWLSLLEAREPLLPIWLQLASQVGF